MPKNPYIKLARKAVETYIKTGQIISLPKNLPKEMLIKKAGTFVSICICRGKEKTLCGCIGTYLPTKDNIADEIISNAISAATRDFRFPPITKDQLEQLSYSVYILNPPEQVSSLEKLDPKKYGVLIKTLDGRSGLLLPDLEGINTPQEQVSIACQKAQINPETEPILLYRFTAEKYE